MNSTKTSHYMLACPEKSARSTPLWEWVSMFAIAIAFVGIAAVYLQS